MSDELESCPACGALPCDWVDNPFSRTPAKAGEDGVERAHAAFVLASAKIERGTRLDSLTTDEEMALVKAVIAAIHGDQEG